MIIKMILENGVELSRYKQKALMDSYKDKGLVSLPKGLFVRTIQGLPPENNEHTVILIIGRQ